MFERFTDRARRVVVLAQEEARLLDHNYIGTEHILLGLIHEGTGVAARALELCDVSLDDTRVRVLEAIKTGQRAPAGHIPFTPRAKKVLELSLREALQLGHNYIGTEHILLGLVREEEGVAAQVLTGMGVDLARVRTIVVDLLAGTTPDPSPRAAMPRVEPAGRAAPELAGSWGGPRPVVCGFCGTPSAESGPMFTGVSGALICVRCARTIVAQGFGAGGLRNTLAWDPPPPTLGDRVAAVIPTGPPPTDEATARAEIEAAFVNMGERTPDGGGLVNVHDGDDLGAYFDEAARRIPQQSRVVTVVGNVVFVNATEAVVWSTSLLDGHAMGGLHMREGRVVLVDGRWLVTRETMCDRLRLAGVQCPPRDDAPPAA